MWLLWESFRLELGNVSGCLPALSLSRSDLLMLNRNNDSEGKNLSRKRKICDGLPPTLCVPGPGNEWKVHVKNLHDLSKPHFLSEFTGPLYLILCNTASYLDLSLQLCKLIFFLFKCEPRCILICLFILSFCTSFCTTFHTTLICL